MVEMDKERYKRWIRISHILGKIEPFLVPIVQELGILDSRLRFGDAKYIALPIKDRDNIGGSLELSDRFMFSRLWVLGVYELVRTLDQRCKDKGGFFGGNLDNKIEKLKHSIARLRMPLAKLEPAEKYKNTDHPIAIPAIHKSLGVSWRVAPNVYISRQQLSDSLLSILEEIAEKQKV